MQQERSKMEHFSEARKFSVKKVGKKYIHRSNFSIRTPNEVAITQCNIIFAESLLLNDDIRC